MNNIFVSIASYRDDNCINTINSIYENAKNPFNIYLGICQQNNDKIDMDCLNNDKIIIDDKLKNNIRIIRIPYYDAKGPNYARYLCSSLLDKNNDKYYLQIDSHTIFIKNWDEICINMINEIKDLGLSKKPVLSYYPEDFSRINKNKNNNVPVITGIFFDDKKQIFVLNQAVYINTNGIYIKTPFVTGGMFFCESYFLDELPYDPTLDYLFTGEEILQSIKFYTNGWDVFVPKINICFHEYLRNNKPKYWQESKINFDDTKALDKVRYYLFNDKNKSNHNYYNNYCLGTKRTLNNYYKFANINIEYYKNIHNKNKNKIKHILITISVIILIIIILLSYYFYFAFQSYLQSTRI